MAAGAVSPTVLLTIPELRGATYRRAAPHECRDRPRRVAAGDTGQQTALAPRVIARRPLLCTNGVAVVSFPGHQMRTARRLVNAHCGTHYSFVWIAGGE